MPSSHLILCRPLPLLPLIPPNIRVFSNKSTLRMRWPKYWNFSFSIIPSKEIPGLIFRMDCLDLLAVQGTLKSLLQHHSSKASIFRRSAFFTVQLSHPYMTTGKTIALTTALKMDHSDNIVVCFSGDGSTNEGTFHESLNLASIWELPIIFVVENNQYAMSSDASVMIAGSISDRAKNYNMSAYKVDGQDVFAVRSEEHTSELQSPLNL